MDSHGADGNSEKAAETGSARKKKVITDADLQKKSVKLVVVHLRKKVDPNAAGLTGY